MLLTRHSGNKAGQLGYSAIACGTTLHNYRYFMKAMQYMGTQYRQAVSQ
jgi:hypothetical protein